MKSLFNPNELYKVEEVASVLKVSLKTVYRLIEDGSLPFTRVGFSYRVGGQGLNEYLSTTGTIWNIQPINKK